MLKFDAKNKIILGFILMAVFLLFVGALGWYAVEKTDYIKNVVITGYQIKTELLECRRQEKNILVRGVDEENLVLWQKAFAESLRIINTAKHKGYISLKENTVLTNDFIAYKKAFDAFLQKLNEKKTLTVEEIKAQDEDFKIYGRVVTTESEKITRDAKNSQLIVEKKIRLISLIVFILGLIIFVLLMVFNIKTINKSFKTIKKLNTTLETNYLELAIGLSEQFEVLNQVAQGNLRIKAPENSGNELLVKLGMVINQTIEHIAKLARQEFEQTFDVAASGLRIIDKEFNVIKVNKAIENISGVSAGEMINKKCYDYFKGDDCHADKCTFKQILSGAEYIQREIEREKFNGEKVFCLLNAKPLRNDEGKIIGIVEDFTDITKLKKAEKELEWFNLTFALAFSELFEVLRRVSKGDLNIQIKEELGDELLNKLAQVVNLTIINLRKLWLDLETAKKYSENIIESIKDMIIVTDSDTAMRFINLATLNTLKFSKEELVGNPIRVVFSDDIKNSELTESELTNCEMSFRRKECGKIPVILNHSVIRNKEGGIIYRVYTAKDITERKQTEKELKDAYDKLKELQFQFVQTEKMAAIGQLAGGVAHEINNPLTGVLNNVQLIKMLIAQGGEFKIEEFKELLDIVEESAQRCQKITKSLLDFSHASMGEFRSISLNKLIEKVTNLISNELNLQNIMIKNELQPDLPDIQGDSQLLQQVIVNFFTNAKWAIQKRFKVSGGLITVKTEHSVKNGFVTMSVTDNGIGIEENKIKKIFEPFFTTKDIGEGTGLGLSVAYNIIKKHKGTISVESQVNAGTTFKISISCV